MCLFIALEVKHISFKTKCFVYFTKVANAYKSYIETLGKITVYEIKKKKSSF